jgi:hypothetical protein
MRMRGNRSTPFLHCTEEVTRVEQAKRGVLYSRSCSPNLARAEAMKSETEKLYLLRLWQEEADKSWHASLKPMGAYEDKAQYFHSLESLVKFIKSIGLARGNE